MLKCTKRKTLCWDSACSENSSVHSPDCTIAPVTSRPQSFRSLRQNSFLPFSSS
uniref:Uncharacterized protein n=1 Tax=Anguilla anguilla TaxID=7936 RepID=A0A0E9XP90_ANGAN